MCYVAAVTRRKALFAQFITAGPDAGRIECSINGGDYRTINTFTHWSAALHLPWA